MDKVREINEQIQSNMKGHAAKAAKYSLTPTHFFISAILLSTVGGLVVATGSPLKWPMLFVVLLMGLRSFCSTIALLLVCEHRMFSVSNVFLSELHIPLSEIFLYLPFAFIHGISGPLVVAVVIMGLLCQMVSIVAIPIINSRRHDGPITSTERLMIFAAMAFFLGIGFPATVWCNIVLFALLLLEFATLVNRIKKANDLAQ